MTINFTVLLLRQLADARAVINKLLTVLDSRPCNKPAGHSWMPLGQRAIVTFHCLTLHYIKSILLIVNCP
jgi:hypothetical protein